MEPGTYAENIDFKGKMITVVGAGPTSVLQGTGAGPVVTMASGETAASVLDSMTITGGVADQGGAVFVRGASPTLVRNVLVGNRARQQGSGVFLADGAATLLNNLIVYNDHADGDPHSIEIQSGAPVIRNNTIVRGDSNGLIVRTGAAPVIMNNVIAYNGSVVATSAAAASATSAAAWR